MLSDIIRIELKTEFVNSAMRKKFNIKMINNSM